MPESNCLDTPDAEIITPFVRCLASVSLTVSIRFMGTSIRATAHESAYM
ncbi:Uncharacterised protein [Mycobacteroides abscessus subsp. abscessus]|nr:Uncharacterised protein [Mycobacteroides abscessus subsp. abscessus]